MHKFFIILSAALLVTTTALASLRTNVEDSNKSVVYIETPTGSGSGVFIRPDGTILTAYHVIKKLHETDPYTIKVETFDGQEYQALVVWVDTEHDLALLQITATPLKVAPLDCTGDVRAGDEAYIIGHPGGVWGWSASFGHISALRIFGKNQYYQSDALAWPGNSGGGLFDYQGHLIGLVQSIILGKLNDGTQHPMGYSMAIRASFICTILPKAN